MLLSHSHIHAHINSVDEALECLERLCYQLNERQRASEEEAKRVAELERVVHLIEPPMKQLMDTPTRKLEMELDLQLVNNKRGTVQERHAFIFTDCVVLTKRSKLHTNRFHYKDRFSLQLPCQIINITTSYGL